MKKKILTVAIFVITILNLNICVNAGQWTQNNAKWQYINDDGSLVKNQWAQIAGKWYCFDNSGNMYENTFTPDGYLVASSGEWVIPGASYMNVAVTNNADQSAMLVSDDLNDDCVVLSDFMNEELENNHAALIDRGTYYSMDDMCILKGMKENSDLYYIPSVMNILYKGPVYFRKDCVINEILYTDSGWIRAKATILEHMHDTNTFPNKYATGQIFGFYKLDCNGLVTEIDQIFLS